MDRFGGYTIQEANGGWKGDDLIDAFHQSSVLIQANETSTEFYYGE